MNIYILLCFLIDMRLSFYPGMRDVTVYTLLISNAISGSPNLSNCFYHCLILILISHLKDLFNSLLKYYIIYNLYSCPSCGSTTVLPGYLLLWHSCTWDKTSTLWSCQLDPLICCFIESISSFSFFAFE